jgi:hypothetical protein
LIHDIERKKKLLLSDMILARNGAIHKFFLVGFLFFNVCKGRGTSTEELFCSYYLPGSTKRVWGVFFSVCLVPMFVILS